MADPKTYRPRPGEIPASPGVYRFSDAAGRVVYVGKAISLRSRLASYFADPATLPNRTRAMVFSAAKVEWTTVRNEVEALQLEYTWIQQFSPRFNVKYRDDKSYPWVCLTWSEEYPRVFVGRGGKRKGWRYFGPYGQAWAIRGTVDTLLGVFPIRSCSDGVFRTARASGRPCLLGHIGKCAAPCVGRVTAAAHRAVAEDFGAVLGGRITVFLRRFEAEMQEAAQRLEYERAATLRDRVHALSLVAERNAVVLADGTDADVIALAVDPLEVAVQLFRVRDGRLVGERGWVADRADDTDLPGLVEAFCLQLYADGAAGLDAAERRRAIPAEVLVPELPPSAADLAELLTAERQGKVSVRVPRRGSKRDLLDTAERNAAEALVLHKTRRASDLTTRNLALGELQEALGLAEAPLRIECYDISHLQGQHTVASMVVFEDGLARPSQYRHFLIRTVASNDVGAMREVLSRRFARLRDEEALLRGGGAAEPPPEAKEVLIRPLSTPCPTRGAAELLPEAKEVAAAASVPPVGQAAAPAPTAASPASAALVLPAADDEPGPAAGLIDASTRAPRRFSYAPSLIVVDGAAGQVAAAQAALDGLGVTGVALCGLAKRLEEVWLPGQEFPLILPRASEAMYLLQRLRDEAHRFAIAYHRKRRGQSMVESILDDVSGLGEVRRKALLRRFGSLKKLRAATADEIAQTPGFGPRLAEAVAAAVASRPAGAAVNTATGEIADL